MVKNSYKQSGSAHLVIIVIVVIALLGALGFVFWKNHMNKTPAKSVQSSATTPNATPKSETQKTFSLLDGKIKLKDSGTWKIATGGYYSKANGKCGQGTAADPCLDYIMLIPSDETFTNPDQFQVNIGVFRSNDLSPQDWLKQNADPGGEDAETSTTKINGFDSYRYEVSYGDNEIRLAYAIKINDNIVLVSSSLFNGDYYSYKNNKDYRPRASAIDTLVKSISQ